MARFIHVLHKLGIAFAVVLTGSLVAPARSDEVQYLPGGCAIVYSIDLPAVLKSKTYQEVKKQLPEFNDVLEGDIPKNFGVPLANIARITGGAGAEPRDFCLVISTIKPIKAGEIVATLTKARPNDYRKNLVYKQVKVGPYTVYEENFQLDFEIKEKGDKAAVITGEAFCVVEDKRVVHGRLETLKPILADRDKPAPSPGVQAGLKHTGYSSVLTIAFDPRAMPMREREAMVKELGPIFPGLEDGLDNVKALTLRVSETDKIQVAGTILCSDAATAPVAKRIAEAGRGKLKELTKEINERDLAEFLRTSLDAVKLSVKGSQVNAEVAIAPATAVSMLRYVMPQKKEKKPASVEK